jgi:hypothetical protein
MAGLQGQCTRRRVAQACVPPRPQTLLPLISMLRHAILRRVRDVKRLWVAELHDADLDDKVHEFSGCLRSQASRTSLRGAQAGELWKIG